jgi:hypothetical protein
MMKAKARIPAETIKNEMREASMVRHSERMGRRYVEPSIALKMSSFWLSIGSYGNERWGHLRFVGRIPVLGKVATFGACHAVKIGGMEVKGIIDSAVLALSLYLEEFFVH